jgi:hypothetical protein
LPKARVTSGLVISGKDAALELAMAVKVAH